MSCTIYYSDQKLLFAEMDTRIFQFQSHFKFFFVTFHAISCCRYSAKVIVGESRISQCSVPS